MTTATKGWPPKRRREQAKRCGRVKPWKQSTGPVTDAGKARMKENPLRHGLRSAEGVELRRLLRLQKDFVRNILVLTQLSDPID